MDYVVVAKVVSTHGIKGDLKLFPLTDFAKVHTFTLCHQNHKNYKPFCSL